MFISWAACDLNDCSRFVATARPDSCPDAKHTALFLLDLGGLPGDEIVAAGGNKRELASKRPHAFRPRQYARSLQGGGTPTP
jgi:hypothetical protein